MKKLASVISACCIVFTIAADDSSYYYRGGEEALTKDGSKIVVISPAGRLPQIPMGSGMSVVEKLSDSLSTVLICEVSPSSDIASVRRHASQSSQSVTVLPCYRNDEGLELAPTGYIHVELRSAGDINLLREVADAHGCTIVRRDPNMPLWHTLHLSAESGGNPVEVANEIYETGKFLSSSPAFSFDPLEISYDPDVTRQWGLYNATYAGIDISASGAWDYSTGSGIRIAVIDQGIELTHVDLADNICGKSYDACTGQSPSVVYNTGTIGHGTHCAGIAAAVRNNGIQVAGVAPDAELMSVSCDFNGTDPLRQLTDGINWAWRNGADIISCSWRCPRSAYLEAAIDSAIVRGREGRGCIVVKSAGNTSAGITYPGNYREEILAVGNLQKDGSIAKSSSHGSNMLVCAPGSNILSTMVNNTTAEMSGTSMACPHVSGVAALILGRNPRLSAAKVREIIARSAKKIGGSGYSTTKKYGAWDEYYGYGLVDAHSAVLNTPL